ncbi:MAG: acetate/propionate family kinase [Ilumatobacteraceae bacterium]|nr:acetate/propionate family kinase [Ilumatobacteraceae bacterium]
MQILVVNAGSSSVKLSVLDDQDVIVHSAVLPANVDGFDTARLDEVLGDWGEPDLVGHRIVHGGRSFRGPVRIDASVRAELDALTDLAPLHQPKSLAALDAVTARLPHVDATASFDTAFHATIPPAASTYAIPREWTQRWDIRRYGFHGLSHAYAARRAAQLTGRPTAGLRIVSCHLGAGASVTAIVDGRSVDTTMGFTPLEGLVMATRSGTVDPGLILWLEDHEHLASREIATALEQRSGLLAIAGTADMREVEAAVSRGDERAQLALDVYVHRLVGGIAAMAASAAGIDVLVFTGGVGEHSSVVRRRAADRLAFLGVAVDAHLDASVAGDADLSGSGAPVRTLVITAREDIQIAHEARSLVGRAAPG